MRTTPILATAINELNRLLNNAISGTKLEEISQTINQYAVASAIASVGIAFVPGAGGVAAALTQAGFVWSTYVKINRILGVSMTDEFAKFIGTAFITNLMTQYGIVLIGHAFAQVISNIPLIGGFLAAIAEASIGYVLIYACAFLYLKLICKMVGKDGSIQVPDNKGDAEKTIKELMKDEDILSILKEAKEQFNAVRSEGTIDSAIRGAMKKNN